MAHILARKLYKVNMNMRIRKRIEVTIFPYGRKIPMSNEEPEDNRWVNQRQGILWNPASSVGFVHASMCLLNAATHWWARVSSTKTSLIQEWRGIRKTRKKYYFTYHKQVHLKPRLH